MNTADALPGSTEKGINPPIPKRRASLFALREEIPRSAGLLSGILFIALILAVWYAVTAAKLVPSLFLPSPAAVIQEGVRQITTGILWQDMGVSVYRIMVGWLVATIFAVPVGILMGNFKLFEGMFEPAIDLVRYMPTVAFVPLTILWAGIGDEQKFLILFIGTFFQEVLMIMDNVKNVPIDLIHIGYTLGLNKWEALRYIVLPATLPGIWDTFRITVGWTWTYLVVAEMVAANSGLGRRIMQAQRFLATDTIIFGILVIGLLGLLTDLTFKTLYRRMFRWMKG
jgi:NitT/TauT family transport system permease protein